MNASHDSNQKSADRRKVNRWALAEPVTGIVTRSDLRRVRIPVTVVDLAAGGMGLHVPAETVDQLGTRVTLHLEFPGQGRFVAKARVIWERQQLPHCAVGVRFYRPGARLREAVAQHLFRHQPGVTLHDLRDTGLRVRRSFDVLKFSFVESEAEYRQVVELRHRAYSGVGKIDAEAPLETMADVFDQDAKIMMVKHHDRVIASMRCSFPQEGDLTEHGKYATFPPGFPGWNQCMELSRLCIDERYRQADIFRELCVRTVTLGIESGRRYLLSGASGYLLEKYDRVGVRRTGITYRNLALNGLQHEIVLGDNHALATGRGTTPLAWAYVYAGMARDLRKRGLVVNTMKDRARVFANVAWYKTLSRLRSA